MAATDKHREFRRLERDFLTAKDMMEGERAIRGGSRCEEYLPRGADEKLVWYQKRKQRAEFDNYPLEALGKLIGKIMRKPPVVTGATPKLQEVLGKITDDCHNLETLVSRAAGEMIWNTHGGLFWDTEDDGETLGLPVVQLVKALDFVDWDFQRVGGRSRLAMVRIKSSYKTKVKGVVKVLPQFIELRLAPTEEHGLVYASIVLRPEKEEEPDGKFKQYELKIPKFFGQPLDFIPFWPLWPLRQERGTLSGPMLLPLMNKTIALYRNSASYEKALVEAAKSTYVVKGYEAPLNEENEPQNEAKLIPGTPYAWDGGPEFEATILQPQGTGATLNLQAMEAKKRDLERLALEFTNAQSVKPETATAATFRNIDNGAKLAVVSVTLSKIFTDIVQLTARATLHPEDVTVQVNGEFLERQMDVTTAKGWAELSEQGAISKEVMIYQFRRGEVYPPDHDLDEEARALERKRPKYLQG